MSDFPEHDDHFQEHTIDRVTALDGGGWEVGFDGCVMFHIPAASPVEPKVGMTMRLYGRGLGFAVRGLFLDGQRVFYRTEAEDEEHQEIQRYGADAADWLAKWDRGETVWTIEMGGLGPGYEQAIQITVAELLRIMLAGDYHPDFWEDAETRKREFDHIQEQALENETIKKLGLSGAQYGAAANVAGFMFRKGPRALMKEVDKERRIMVSKTWPSAA